jgi:hypothetical protein
MLPHGGQFQSEHTTSARGLPLSGIGREVVPQHQPHRDVEGDNYRHTDDQIFHEGPRSPFEYAWFANCVWTGEGGPRHSARESRHHGILLPNGFPKRICWEAKRALTRAKYLMILHGERGGTRTLDPMIKSYAGAFLGVQPSR